MCLKNVDLLCLHLMIWEQLKGTHRCIISRPSVKNYTCRYAFENFFPKVFCENEGVYIIYLQGWVLGLLETSNKYVYKCF